jgi:hypothetical protein
VTTHGCDIDTLLAAPLPKHLRDDPLAASVAVSLRRIYEIAAQIQGPVQRDDGILVGLVSPAAADSPGAEADFGHVPAQTPEVTVFHAATPPPGIVTYRRAVPVARASPRQCGEK